MQPDNRREYRVIEEDLRSYNPIETVEVSFDDTELVSSLQHDIGRIDHILESDHTLTYEEKADLYEMGVNLRLDWLYAKHGGKSLDMAPFEVEAKSAEEFIKRAEEHAKKREHVNPLALWQLQIKELDLGALRTHRYLKESQTTLKGTPGEARVRDIANANMQQILHASAALMKRMEPEAHGEGQLGRDTRGVLYELMLTTYARFQTYEEESFDEVFVRTALSREDRPWTNANPKHSFDIVIERPTEAELLQAKNHKNSEIYQAPIRKVSDPTFGRTLSDLRSYVDAFHILTDNSVKPDDPRTILANRRLRATFGKHLDASVV